MGEAGAVAKENVVIRAGACALTVMPALGGKIASLTLHGQQLLQAPLSNYALRTQTMSFDAGDASGWDECLPSVAACTVQTEAGPTEVSDHGDLWRVQWQETAERSPAQSSLALQGSCFSLPLTLERTLQLSETATGWKLQLDYRLRNTGAFPAPWSWAAHPLFVVEAGDRIVLPESIKMLRLEGSGGGRLGKSGDAVSWPLAKLTSGGETDLSLAQGADSGIGDKLFAGPLTANENWCTLERPAAGLRIKVGFDPAENPYLGLWICYGGWPERAGAKQMCVALEPATAPVDSLAVTGPWSRTLKPGDSATWQMTVEIESIASVN
jgi:galactose mutarotase-like enzyme